MKRFLEIINRLTSWGRWKSWALGFCLSAFHSAQALDRSDIYQNGSLASAGQRAFAKSYAQIFSLLDRMLLRNENLPMKGHSHRSEVLGRLYKLYSGYVAVRYSDLFLADNKDQHIGENNYFQIVSSGLLRFDLQPPNRRDLFRVNSETGDIEPTIQTARLFNGAQVVFLDANSGALSRAKLDLGGEVLGLTMQLKELEKLWFHNSSVQAILNTEDQEDFKKVFVHLAEIRSDFSLE